MSTEFQNPYPRNNSFRTPRREVDIAAIGEAWGVVTQNLGPFILAALVTFALNAIPSFIGSFIAGRVFPTPVGTTDLGLVLRISFMQQPIQLPFQAIGSGLSMIVAGSIVLMTLKAIRGQSPEVSDIGLGFTTSPASLFVAGVLIYLGTMVGILLCLIPGLILGGLWMVTVPFIMDKGVGPIEAMKMSWNLMKDHVLMAAVILLLGGMIMILGCCCACIGLLVALPLLYATQAIIYEDLTADDNGYGGYQPPSSDPFAGSPSSPNE